MTSAIATSSSDGRKHAFFVIDLNDFKHVNDLHGHAIGDDVLRVVAERFRTVARPNDLLARIGGDEFAMLLYDVDRDTSRAIGLRFLTALESKIQVGGCLHGIGASVGAALIPDDGTTAERSFTTPTSPCIALKGKIRPHSCFSSHPATGNSRSSGVLSPACPLTRQCLPSRRKADARKPWVSVPEVPWTTTTQPLEQTTPLPGPVIRIGEVVRVGGGAACADPRRFTACIRPVIPGHAGEFRITESCCSLWMNRLSEVFTWPRLLILVGHALATQCCLVVRKVSATILENVARQASVHNSIFSPGVETGGYEWAPTYDGPGPCRHLVLGCHCDRS